MRGEMRLRKSRLLKRSRENPRLWPPRDRVARPRYLLEYGRLPRIRLYRFWLKFGRPRSGGQSPLWIGTDGGDRRVRAV
jgi:hypothetical protein